MRSLSATTPAIFALVELFFNRQRLHRALDDRSPVDFASQEQNLWLAASVG